MTCHICGKNEADKVVYVKKSTQIGESAVEVCNICIEVIKKIIKGEIRNKELG